MVDPRMFPLCEQLVRSSAAVPLYKDQIPDRASFPEVVDQTDSSPAWVRLSTQQSYGNISLDVPTRFVSETTY